MAQDYRNLKDKDYADPLLRVMKLVEANYNLSVLFKKLEYPITGDFDGTTIWISNELNNEAGLFILLHIFGHTIQFNKSEELRKIGLTRFGPDNINPEIMKTIEEYEKGASELGINLLHMASVDYLDQWLSDWYNADWAYLKKLYETGMKPDPKSVKVRFMIYESEILLPALIPDFKPEKWESRQAF